MPNFIEIGQTSLEIGVGREKFSTHRQDRLTDTHTHTRHPDWLSCASQHARGATKNPLTDGKSVQVERFDFDTDTFAFAAVSLRTVHVSRFIRTECAVIGRGHGELGRFSHNVRYSSSWLQPIAVHSSRCVWMLLPHRIANFDYVSTFAHGQY